MGAWRLCSALTIALVCMASPTGLLAQDDADLTRLNEQYKIDIVSTDVSLVDLAQAMKPMFKEQLATLADAWQRLVQEISLEIANDGMTTERQAEKIARLDRYRAVIRAYRDKGGDIGEYQKYYEQVSGIVVNPQDAGAASQALLDWVKSPQGGLRWAKNILFALLALLLFYFTSGISGRLTDAAIQRSHLKLSKGLRRFFVGIAKKAVLVIGVIVALSILEVDIGPFVAAIGVGGFVVGFALKDALGNFAAGVLILMYRPFEIGDVITATGITGKVEDISLVSTKFLTPDNQTIYVPNSSVWGGVITNVTGNERRRVDMTFGIGYDDDIKKAEQVLNEIVLAHPKVLADPAPTVKLAELADSSVNFVVRPWAATGDHWEVRCDITRTVKERFDQEGLSIPYPQQDVHIHQGS